MISYDSCTFDSVPVFMFEDLLESYAESVEQLRHSDSSPNQNCFTSVCYVSFAVDSQCIPSFASELLPSCEQACLIYCLSSVAGSRSGDAFRMQMCPRGRRGPIASIWSVWSS